MAEITLMVGDQTLDEYIAELKAAADKPPVVAPDPRVDDAVAALQTISTTAADVLELLLADPPAVTPDPPPTTPPPSDPPPAGGVVGSRRLAVHSLGFPNAMADLYARGGTATVFDFAHFGSPSAMFDRGSSGWDLADIVRYMTEGISNGAGLELTMQPNVWPIRDRTDAHRQWVTQWGLSTKAMQDAGLLGPLPVAFGHEMSGEWTQKSAWNAQDWSIRQGGSDPEDFAAWFRWVVETVRATGAVIEPIFAPATMWPAHVGLVRRAYPGDDIVHSTGLSWYPHSGNLWPRRRGISDIDDFLSLENQFGLLTDIAPSKPVGINEFGLGHTVITPELIDELFAVLAEWPVEVIKFFNMYKPEAGPEENDYRLFADRESGHLIADQSALADRFVARCAEWQAA